MEIQVLKVMSSNIVLYSLLTFEVLQLNVLMVVTFFVIWSPYAIFSIVTLYYPDLPAFWYSCLLFHLVAFLLTRWR